MIVLTKDSDIIGKVKKTVIVLIKDIEVFEM